MTVAGRLALRSVAVLSTVTRVVAFTLIYKRDGCMVQIWVRIRILHTRRMLDIGDILRPGLAVASRLIECKLL